MRARDGANVSAEIVFKGITQDQKNDGATSLARAKGFFALEHRKKLGISRLKPAVALKMNPRSLFDKKKVTISRYKYVSKSQMKACCT